MSFPVDAIQIDFDAEISYGQDQANVTYPTVFPTVTFQLKPTETLLSLFYAKSGKADVNEDCDIFIGINGFTKTRLDNCIEAYKDIHSWTLDLDEPSQSAVYAALNKQCLEHLGLSCNDLLKVAEAQIL